MIFRKDENPALTAVYVIAAAVILAAIAHGGIYSIDNDVGRTAIVNKFTGSVRICTETKCSKPETPPAPNSPPRLSDLGRPALPDIESTKNQERLQNRAD